MNSNKRLDDYGLTHADKQAWWEYIEHFQPEYYEGAKFYYSGKHDPNLEPDYVPQDMDINDYLAEFKGLPRIKTDSARGVILVNGNAVKRYLGHSQWCEKRLYFARLKQTPAFKRWKDTQYACQDGKCAWCCKHIDLYSPQTHVDHILPLLWWGTNEFSNLVLSCDDCNMEKAANTAGYHGAKGLLAKTSDQSGSNQTAMPSTLIITQSWSLNKLRQSI